MTDPFDDLDEHADREGDPFEDLEPGADVDPGAASDDASGEDRFVDPDPDEADPDSAEADPDPFEYLDDSAPRVPRDESAPGGGDGVGPGPTAAVGDDSDDGDDSGAGSAEQVDVAGEPFGDVDVTRGDPFAADESPFQHVDVESIDPDEVWERFTEGVESAADTAADPSEDDVVVVSKHEFCQGCQHFTPPPEMTCGHEGTEIVEFVGPDDVRLSNCPIVRERRELGEVHE